MTHRVGIGPTGPEVRGIDGPDFCTPLICTNTLTCGYVDVGPPYF